MASKNSSNTGKKKSKTSANYSVSVRDELDKASSGLIHISEADYPYRFFILPAVITDTETGLTCTDFLRSIGITETFLEYELKMSADQFIEERNFDKFFPSLQEIAERNGTELNDPEVVSESKRYRKLEKIFKKHLQHLKVFRVGKVEVHTFIAGLDKHGNIAGLTTIAIET